MKIYRIRNKKNGLFSTGGIEPKFLKKGKIWKQLNHLNSHFAQFKGKYGYPNPYINCEIVIYEITEVEVEVIDL